MRLIKDTLRLVFELPDELFGFVAGAVLNLIFLALAALLLWPLGRALLALRLAKGFYILWVVTIITALLLDKIQLLFRVDADTHIDAYVISNLAHSVFMLAGWSAFAALAVRAFTADAPVWMDVILYVVGFLSSHLAFIVLSAIYTGRTYRGVNLCAAWASFILFAVLPGAGRAVYGWFFDIFGASVS